MPLFLELTHSYKGKNKSESAKATAAGQSFYKIGLKSLSFETAGCGLQLTKQRNKLQQARMTEAESPINLSQITFTSK